MENTIKNDRSIVPDCGSQIINYQRIHPSEGHGIANQYSNSQDPDNASFSTLQHQEIFAPRAQSSTSKTNLFATSNMQQVSTNQQNSRNESQQSQIDQAIPSFDTNVYNHLYNFSTSAGPSTNTQTVYQKTSHVQQPQTKTSKTEQASHHGYLSSNSTGIPSVKQTAFQNSSRTWRMDHNGQEANLSTEDDQASFVGSDFISSDNDDDPMEDKENFESAVRAIASTIPGKGMFSKNVS